MWIDALCISLWVDALCINQSSEPDALRERERQVHIDKMLKLFYIVASVPEERWKASKEGREVVDELSNSYAPAILFGYHIKSSSIGHGSGVFGYLRNSHWQKNHLCLC